MLQPTTPLTRYCQGTITYVMFQTEIKKRSKYLRCEYEAVAKIAYFNQDFSYQPPKNRHYCALKPVNKIYSFTLS